MTTQTMLFLLALGFALSMALTRVPRRSRNYFRLAGGFGIMAVSLVYPSPTNPLAGYGLTAFGLGLVIWGISSLHRARATEGKAGAAESEGEEEEFDPMAELGPFVDTSRMSSLDAAEERTPG